MEFFQNLWLFVERKEKSYIYTINNERFFLNIKKYRYQHQQINHVETQFSFTHLHTTPNKKKETTQYTHRVNIEYKMNKISFFHQYCTKDEIQQQHIYFPSFKSFFSSLYVYCPWVHADVPMFSNKQTSAIWL
jgi:hypothetical protein